MQFGLRLPLCGRGASASAGSAALLFRASPASTQVVDQTDTVITFGTEVFDVGSHFTPGTIFTVPAALDGLYAEFVIGLTLDVATDTDVSLEHSTGASFTKIVTARKLRDSIVLSSGPVLLATGDEYRVTGIRLAATSTSAQTSSFLAVSFAPIAEAA